MGKKQEKWWSILLRSMGVLLTDSYKFYLQICKEEGVKPWYKEQRQLRKAIAEYWINIELVTSEKESKKMKFEFEIPFPSTFSTISLLSPVTSTCTTIATDCSNNQRASRLDNDILEPTGILSL